jgi:hypothetical protein
MMDPDDSFFQELCEHHISGQLKIAPEHISQNVLDHMGKPGRKVYDRFVEKYRKINERLGKKQFLVPYLMSSHPGSTLNEAVELAEYLRDTGSQPEQVQDFYPTPGTLSTCMFYTGLDPRTMKPVYVPTDPHEKAMQRALIQYRKPQNRGLVLEALQKSGRRDLIGTSKKALVRDDGSNGSFKTYGTRKNKPSDATKTQTTDTSKSPNRSAQKGKSTSTKAPYVKATNANPSEGSSPTQPRSKNHSTGKPGNTKNQNTRTTASATSSKGKARTTNPSAPKRTGKQKKK